MKKKSFYSGVFYMLFSATGLAFTGFLGQFALQQMTLNAVIFWRYLTSCILCFFLLALMRQLKGIFELGNIKMHLLRAFFVLVAQYSFYYYLQKNTLFNALVLLNTGPLFIPLIEWGILRHRVGHSTWAGVFVSLIGVVCVLQPDKEILSLVSLVGLLAGISQGASQVVFGLNWRTERTDLSVLYNFFLCSVVSLIPYLLIGETWIAEQKEMGLWLIFGLGAASVCNQITRASAYQHGSPSALAAFLYFSILLGALFDFVFFGVIPNALSTIGAILVVLGGVLKIYLRHRVVHK